MKTYYKIMDYSKDGPKTLFHANNGSKIIPMKEWIEATRYEMVTDGSSSTQYMSGWHVFESLEEAKKYLFKSFKNIVGKIIVKCHIMGEIRPKYHSRANVWLAQMLYLDECVFHQLSKKKYLTNRTD
jgi:hypothetical protein